MVESLFSKAGFEEFEGGKCEHDTSQYCDPRSPMPFFFGPSSCSEGKCAFLESGGCSTFSSRVPKALCTMWLPLSPKDEAESYYMQTGPFLR